MGLVLRRMWDLLGPGVEPVFPALADRFLTTVPPGKSNKYYFLKKENIQILYSELDCTLPKGILAHLCIPIG